MVTLKQIADLTNVSVSTVSRVLSNKGKISEATRQKILAAVEELVFEPGVVAQAAQKNSYNIALYIPKHGEYYQNDPSSSVDMRSLMDEFQKHGDSTEFIYQNASSGFTEILTRFEQEQIQGVIVMDPLRENSVVDRLIEHKIPYIITNGHFRDNRYNFIDFNNYDGACQVTQHLLEMGHREFGVLSGPNDHLVSCNRLDGVRYTLEASGLSLDPQNICSGEFSLDGGYDGFKRLQESGRSFSVIIAFSDFIAMGALKAMREAGLSMPDDLSIVGFDNLRIADFCDPPLTTVNRFSKEISYLLVRMMQDLIRFGEKVEAVNINLKTDLVVRQSVKKL